MSINKYKIYEYNYICLVKLHSKNDSFSNITSILKQKLFLYKKKSILLFSCFPTPCLDFLLSDFKKIGLIKVLDTFSRIINNLFYVKLKYN